MQAKTTVNSNNKRDTNTWPFLPPQKGVSPTERATQERWPILHQSPWCRGRVTSKASQHQLLACWLCVLTLHSFCPPLARPHLTYSPATQNVKQCGLQKACNPQASCGTSDDSCKCIMLDAGQAKGIRLGKGESSSVRRLLYRDLEP